MGVSTQPRTPLAKGAPTDSHLAAEVKGLLARGDRIAACQLFEELMARHQHRATRIAFHYLRDPADVDEAVQDSFLKAFLHLPSFRDELRFELWFTKIVVNGCLDRLKARKRRTRWFVASEDKGQPELAGYPAGAPSPEATLLAGERNLRLHAAVDELPERQRAVVLLSQFRGHSAREVSKVLGISEATVRVHLFRAVRSLRKQLSRHTWLSRAAGRRPGGGKA